MGHKRIKYASIILFADVVSIIQNGLGVLIIVDFIFKYFFPSTFVKIPNIFQLIFG